MKVIYVVYETLDTQVKIKAEKIQNNLFEGDLLCRIKRRRRADSLLPCYVMAVRFYARQQELLYSAS